MGNLSSRSDRDFNYPAAVKFIPTTSTLSASLKCIELTEVTSAFAWNLLLISNTLRMLPLWFDLGTIQEWLFLEADYNVYGKLRLSPADVANKEMQARVADERQRLLMELNRELWKDPKNYDQRRLDRGLEFLTAYLDSRDWLRDGVDSTFSGAIVNVWTAFETLAADLWVVCVNLRPRLGSIALATEPGSDDTEEQVVAKARKQHRFTVQKLFNTPNVMNSIGTLLRDDWAKFTRREGILDAYFTVFGRDEERLKFILKSEKLKHLSALRNVLVHKAGVADEEFLRMTKNDSRLSQFSSGEKVLLNGEIVCEFCNEVERLGSELIKFVDDWLHKNPQ